MDFGQLVAAILPMPPRFLLFEGSSEILLLLLDADSFVLLVELLSPLLVLRADAVANGGSIDAMLARVFHHSSTAFARFLK